MRLPKTVLAVTTVGTLLIFGSGSAWASEGSGAPFTDPSAAGYIGLCDASMHQVTHGSIYTTPFAVRAVSSVAAPTNYAKAGRTAILLAYQPIEYVPASEWSGEEMTASSRYTNSAHPMAEATSGDDSLADFISDYPPHEDNFIELRLYLGGINEPTYSYRYPALDIQVTGTTWHQVGGGSVNCTDGSAESIESIVLGSTTTTTPGSSSQTTVPSSATTDPAQALGTTHGSNDLPLVLAVAAGVAALGALGVATMRRRRRAAATSSSTLHLSQSTTERNTP
jgi:hypothetical protein